MFHTKHVELFAGNKILYKRVILLEHSNIDFKIFPLFLRREILSEKTFSMTKISDVMRGVKNAFIASERIDWIKTELNGIWK
jgi:hypothetical protein